MANEQSPQFEVDEEFRRLVVNTARSMLDHDTTPRLLPPGLETDTLPLGHIAFRGDFEPPGTDAGQAASRPHSS